MATTPKAGDPEVSGLVERLPAEWRENAASVRQIDSAGTWPEYWRGYATALEMCARVLSARAALANPTLPVEGDDNG